MKKIKGLLIMPTILVIVVTFFGGIAFAARVTSVNKEKGHVFVDDGEVFGLIMGTEKCFFLPPGEQLVDSIVQEISASESVAEKNKKLVGWERKEKRKSTYQKYKESLDKQLLIQDDYIKRRQEQERIKKEEEIEWRKEQEERKKQELEQEREKIKKEDPFR
jgi:hypothetical protein